MCLAYDRLTCDLIIFSFSCFIWISLNAYIQRTLQYDKKALYSCRTNNTGFIFPCQQYLKITIFKKFLYVFQQSLVVILSRIISVIFTCPKLVWNFVTQKYSLYICRSDLKLASKIRTRPPKNHSVLPINNPAKYFVQLWKIFRAGKHYPKSRLVL